MARSQGPSDSSNDDAPRGANTRRDWRKKAAPGAGQTLSAGDFRVRAHSKVTASILQHRLKIVGLLAIFSLGLAGLVYALAMQPKSAPLLIGAVTEYQPYFPPNALAAEDLARLESLDADKGAHRANVEVTRFGGALSQDESHAEFLGAIRSALSKIVPGVPRDAGWFSRGRPVVLLYVSAHGAVDGNQEPCLLMNGSKLHDANSWLKVATLLDEVFAHPRVKNSSAQVVLFLDANRQLTHWRSGLLYNSFTERLGELVGGRQRDRLLVFNSVGGGQRAAVDPELGGSVFGFFVSHGLHGEADVDHDGGITVQEMDAYLRREVATWSRVNRGELQTPVLFASPLADADARNFVLALASKLNTELPAPRSIVNDESVANRRERVAQLWKRIAPGALAPSESPSRESPLRESQSPVSQSSGAPDLSSRQLATVQALDVRRRNPLGWAKLEQSLIHLESLILAGHAYVNMFESQVTDIERQFVEVTARGRELELAANSLPLADAMHGADGDEADPALFVAWRQARMQKPPTPFQFPESLNAREVGRLTWRVLLERRDSLTAKQLDELLEFLREAQSPTANDFVEIHFLRLLSAHLDRSSPLDRSLAKALSCRDWAEQAAAPLDERVFYWNVSAVDHVDDQRRQLEDRLFVGDRADLTQRLPDQFEASRKSYEESCRRASELAGCYELRDRVLAELPYLSEWLVAMHRRRAVEDAHDTPPADRLTLPDAQVISEIAGAVQELSHVLDSAEIPSVGIATEVGQVRATLTEKWAELTGSFYAHIEQLKTSSLVDRARLASIEDALATPLLRSDDRDMLLEKLLASTATLTSSATPTNRNKPATTNQPTANQPTAKGRLESMGKSESKGQPASTAETDSALPDDTSFLRQIAQFDRHPALTILGDSQIRSPLLSTADRNQCLAWFAAQGEAVRQRLTTLHAASDVDPNHTRLTASVREVDPRSIRLQSSQADRSFRAAVAWTDPAVWVNGRSPTDRLRNLDCCFLSFWHARRVLDDFWNDLPGDPPRPDPYFVRLASSYLRARNTLELQIELPSENWQGENLGTLRNKRLAAAKQLVELRVPDEPQFYVDSTSARMTAELSPQAELPSGQAFVEVRRDAASPESLDVQYQERNARRHALTVGGAAALDHQKWPATLSRDSFDAKNERESLPLDIRLFYRGHQTNNPFRARFLRADQVVIHPTIKEPARLRVSSHVRKVGAMMFILDASNSMNSVMPGEAAVNGPTRWEVARRVLLETLREFAQETNLKPQQQPVKVGLFTFGSRFAQLAQLPRFNNEEANADVHEEVRFPTTLTEESIKRDFEQQLTKFQPSGFSPISLSLIKSVEQIRDAQDKGKLAQDVSAIVLITDGVEELAGERENHPGIRDLKTRQAKQSAKMLLETIAGVPLFVIFVRDDKGIDPTDLRALAQRSGGELIYVNSGSEVRAQLERILRKSDYVVQSPADDAGPAATVPINQTWTRPPALSRGPQRFTVSVPLLQGARGITTEVVLEGGEYLDLQFDRLKKQLRFLPFEPDTVRGEPLPVSLSNLADVGGSKLGDSLLVRSHVPERSGNHVTFATSLQAKRGGELDNAEWLFTRRPSLIWAEVRPMTAAKTSLPTYYFYDAIYESGLPVPKLRWTARNWPLEAVTAEIHFWFRLDDRTVSQRGLAADKHVVVDKEHFTFDLDNPAVNDSPGAPPPERQPVNVRVERRLASTSQSFAIIVTETSPSPSPLPLHLEMIPTPDSIMRQADPETRLLRTTFAYDDTKWLESRQPELFITTSSTIKKAPDTLRLPRPMVVDTIAR